jgi:CDP-diacylglycerol---glycerol-3-phosphate 3-phosphatidyltransferase
MAISRGSDGPGNVEPIAAATPQAASSAPVLSRHALRAVAGPPAELEVEVSPPPKPAPARAVPAPDEPRTAASDPGTFWNLPNTITVLRAAVVPVLLLHPLVPGEFGSTVMAWIFIVAAVSDLVDGWLARRGKQVTHIGVLLDPLADKLLVTTALIVLLAMGRIPIWGIWMVVTIVGRELAVTGLRGIASAGGQIVAASGLGKIKTVAQNIAVGALLFHYETLGLDANRVGLVFLFIATALTIASGYRYFADYFRGLARAGR